MADRGDWRIDGFLERVEIWGDEQAASIDLRIVVTEWVFSRYDDPYAGARREEGFENLWYVVVPNSAHGNGDVVICSFWIDEEARVVRCDNVATVGWPV